MYPVLLTPAGYAFSIWGLIYLLLAGFVIYQFVPASWKRDSITRLGYWLWQAVLQCSVDLRIFKISRLVSPYSSSYCFCCH